MKDKGLEKILDKRKKITHIRLFEIVKIYDLDPIYLANPKEEEWKFRIEILQNCTPKGMYFVRVMRRETYRITPTYPLSPTREPLTEPCDKEIFVDDISYDWNSIKGKSIETVIKKVLNQLENLFFVRILF